MTPFLAVEVLDELQDVALGQHVDADGRLVQKEDLRFVHEHERQVGAHLLAQAELPRQGVEELVDAQELLDEGEHGLVAVAGDVPDHPLPLEAGRDRLVPPELGPLPEDYADASHVAHPVLHGVHAQAAHRAGGGRQDAGEELHGRGFPRAVGAGVGDDLAAADGQVDPPQGVDLAHDRAEQVPEDVADLLRALPLLERLVDAGEPNRDVPSRRSAAIRFVHSA